MKFGVDYIGVFAAAVCFDTDGNFLMGKRGGQARDRHGEWVRKPGRLLQEVANYFEVTKNTDNLNSFCRKFPGI